MSARSNEQDLILKSLINVLDAILALAEEIFLHKIIDFNEKMVYQHISSKFFLSLLVSSGDMNDRDLPL